MPQRLFGCHVSAAGGLYMAARNAALLKVNSIQLHASPPQRWNTKPFPPEAARLFNAERPKDLKKVFFHAVYLINLASPSPPQLHLSKASLIHSLELNAAIRGDGVVVHVGSMKGETDESIGYKRAANAINEVLEKAPGGAELLLEVAAGGGAVIGDRFEDLAEIFELIEQKDRTGFALDTQHMWASGYDLKGELEQVVAQADKVFGIKKIKVVHLNDSKTGHASRHDRHANLGEGLIGAEALGRLINHKKLKHLPFILETPGLKEDETRVKEVEKLRKLIK